MKTFKRINSLAMIAAASLLTISSNSMADASNALAACKAEIKQDDRLEGYEFVYARMDEMDARGRYFDFKLDVNTRLDDGQPALWQAQCRARSSGKVTALELTSPEGENALASK